MSVKKQTFEMIYLRFISMSTIVTVVYCCTKHSMFFIVVLSLHFLYSIVFIRLQHTHNPADDKWFGEWMNG